MEKIEENSEVKTGNGNPVPPIAPLTPDNLTYLIANPIANPPANPNSNPLLP